MKMKEIKQMTGPELENLENQLLKEKLNIALMRKTGHLQNSSRQKQIRGDIARIYTELKLRTAAGKTN